jgi:hypothetical protein
MFKKFREISNFLIWGIAGCLQPFQGSSGEPKFKMHEGAACRSNHLRHLPLAFCVTESGPTSGAASVGISHLSHGQDKNFLLFFLFSSRPRQND